MNKLEKLEWGKGIDNVEVYVYMQKLEKYCDRIDKALEEACDLLNDAYDCPAESISNCDICGDLNCEKRCHEHIDSRECWKIWLMEYARKMG